MGDSVRVEFHGFLEIISLEFSPGFFGQCCQRFRWMMAKEEEEGGVSVTQFCNRRPNLSDRAINVSQTKTSQIMDESGRRNDRQ